MIFGADYRIYENVCSLGAFGGGSCGAADADVRVHPVSLSYAGQLTSPADQLSFYATVARNIPGGTEGKEEDLALSRPNAVGDYTILRYGLTIGKASRSDWQVRLRMDGQYTEDALIQGEQFGIGGWNSVRGFLEREVASDRGFSGSLEFYTPNIAPRRIGIDNLRLLIFYDAGVVLRNDPVPGDITRQSIAGAGLGLRMSVKKNLAVRVDGASVIDEGGNQQKDEIRVHFGILVSI